MLPSSKTDVLAPVGEDDVLGEMFIKGIPDGYVEREEQVCRRLGCGKYVNFALTSDRYPSLSILTCNDKKCYLSHGVLGQAQNIAQRSLGGKDNSLALH
jgi:hypothetical protein